MIDLITALLEKSIWISIAILAAGSLGVIEVALRLLVSMRGLFADSRTVMLNEVSELKANDAKIANAVEKISLALLVIVPDKDLRDKIQAALSELQKSG